MSAQNPTEFGIVSISTRDLLSLSKSDRDFVLAASFIVNDIRFHWSLLARSPIDGLDTDLKAMQLTRWLWCTRKLASVIFEALNTLDPLCGRVDCAKANAPIVGRKLRKSPCYAAARFYRNNSAYHFAGEGLDRTLSTFDLGDEHRYFAHLQRGNSISEIAEQIFTLPHLQSMSPSISIQEFDAWTQQCSGQILSFCDRTTADILIAAFPDRIYSSLKIDTGYEMQPANQRWPLFLDIPGDHKSSEP